jgi:hypothetical protein
MLAALQPIGRTQQRIQTCRQSGSIAGRIKPNGSRSLLGNFAMPDGIACNDRQSSQQKVKNLVGDREIATPAVFDLPGKADVMFSNARLRSFAPEPSRGAGRLGPEFSKTEHKAQHQSLTRCATRSHQPGNSITSSGQAVSEAFETQKGAFLRPLSRRCSDR